MVKYLTLTTQPGRDAVNAMVRKVTTSTSPKPLPKMLIVGGFLYGVKATINLLII